MESCAKSGINVDDHFANVSKMIDLAKGAKREIEYIGLSRYACYLIVQNADPTLDENTKVSQLERKSANII
ncbi:hypothetical protein [Pelotomaculum sp. FP]|uniref:hypothetical protein n=1 Tax=Pelotomaculum sp. FP TaxID=261474 RepID=UPI0012914117|nr:hypothetical protein [Pelotomaculum sp. FP]